MPEQRRVNGDARMHEWKKPERNKQENATTTKKKRSRETTTERSRRHIRLQAARQADSRRRGEKYGGN